MKESDDLIVNDEVIILESNMEYIQLFMEYESDDMAMVFFYEVDLDDERFVLREIEVFVDRKVKLNDDFYANVIEACPVPTVDEFNAKIISKEEFDHIWITKSYTGRLTAA